jgi:hypothetical protein
VIWDVKGLIARMGGAAETHRVLTSMTTEPLSPSAVRNWASRESITADWLGLLLVALAERDPKFNPMTYIRWF